MGLLAVLLLAAPETYTGKYAEDPRFHAVASTIPSRSAAALRRIGALLGHEVPGPFEIRFEDAGKSRSGAWAEVRDGERGPVLVLFSEWLLIGAYDLDATLVHELYHCVQRRKLGRRHEAAPRWAREGSALYVAGQADDKAYALAAHVGVDPRIEDPVGRLVNGLDGAHTLLDYFEDVAAFLAAERRHGRAKTVALLNRLLETEDAAAAVRDALGEEFAAFE
ncbi:MAG: hypothetical protein ACREID_01075, partial [Planctomycetota bacterium]